MNDIFNGKGVKVHIGQQDNFLKIKETLTRLGVASKKDKVLYQSCHILHKQGQYSIVHFKELFELDGKQSDFSVEDQARRNLIAKLLDDWGLVTIIDSELYATPMAQMSQVKVLPFSQKDGWTLVHKYNVGKKK